MLTVTIAHADTCLSDYWRGDSRPHVQIPVYRGMTLKAVRDAIRSEISQGAVAGNDDNARALSCDVVPDAAYADELTRKVYAAINRDIRGAKKGARTAFHDLEDADEDDESVYAFFVILVERN